MSPDPPRHEPPYPDGLERRLAAMEGWRGTVDEWRRGVDSWRQTIEREGLVTAVAVIGTKMDQQRQDVAAMRADMSHIKDEVEALQDDRNVRRGVTLTGRTAALVIGAAAGLATIIGLLVALLAGGGAA